MFQTSSSPGEGSSGTIRVTILGGLQPPKQNYKLHSPSLKMDIFRSIHFIKIIVISYLFHLKNFRVFKILISFFPSDKIENTILRVLFKINKGYYWRGGLSYSQRGQVLLASLVAPMDGSQYRIVPNIYYILYYTSCTQIVIIISSFFDSFDQKKTTIKIKKEISL